MVALVNLRHRIPASFPDRPSGFADLSFVERNKYSLIMAAILAVGVVLASIGSLIFQDGINYFYLIPHNKGLTTEIFWQSGVDWIVDN